MTLNLLGMVSETGASYRSAGSCLTATRMAVDDVNKCDTVLKDYDLVYKWIDSKCDPGTALDRMFRHLYHDPPYIMLLGAACSVATEATAQVSYFWNLTQVSYESSSPVLSNRARFPRFFRLYPPDQKLNIARIALMKYFNWTMVATINEAREYFSAVIGDFVQRLEGTGTTVISQEIFVNEPYSRVQNLKRRDARIIITAMYEDMARETLCAAFKIGLYGPHIVWMFTGWFSKTFWKEDLDRLDCNEEEMATAVEGAILTGAVFMNPVEERGAANITAKEFEILYKNNSLYDKKWASTDTIAPFCYDHIWVSSMALDCADKQLRENGYNKTLDGFTYSDVVIGDIVFNCMSNISFTGVSGRLSFRNSSDPDRSVDIERIQDGDRIKIALYRQDVADKHFEWVPGALRWTSKSICTSNY
ncbi:gamma-aminobutyric acid type B receptor subunit 1-like [Ruditapes philippinarum]|uniref:gamma-aminobutyric acid type B receptor subunit 1-like n=1 Tax=Ruditapes philippinarum TaxID=129788 RepID=UPI00295B57D9|nr:gamma-aminobutyric acid type B receptor subunit 1-like [Ruditapes philippinarum]